jgi:hypothetical protein
MTDAQPNLDGCVYLTHDALCHRAKRWLHGTRRCDPVFSNIASCGEIPDAIGWSSAYHWQGSTVIECKTSINDFYADKKKRFAYKHPTFKYAQFSGRHMAESVAKREGYVQVEVPLMGDYRFYFCEAGIFEAELVAEHMPDHGLLWLDGRSIRMMRPAPKRELVDKDSESRYLRFAILNKKIPYGGGGANVISALR